MDTQREDPLRTALASAFECVLQPKTAVYAAVPVTSGLRLWRLASQLGLADLRTVARSAPNEYRDRVFLPNCAYAAEFAATARKQHGLVIDPSRLVIPDWSQKQYWLFWEEIILRYVKILLLSHEWAYSKGCVYECMFAVQRSIPVLSSEGRELAVSELRSNVLRAIRDRISFQVEAEFLDEFMEVTQNVRSRR